jgi:hypothetical protein
LVKVTAGVPGLWQKEYAFIEMSAAAMLESIRPMGRFLGESCGLRFEERVYREWMGGASRILTGGEDRFGARFAALGGTGEGARPRTRKKLSFGGEGQG